jgi:hypothetical protein
LTIEALRDKTQYSSQSPFKNQQQISRIQGFLLVASPEKITRKGSIQIREESEYTKRGVGNLATIFFASAFVGSIFSGYFQAALYPSMDGTGGLAGWRWLFISVSDLTHLILEFGYALPDLPSILG